MSSSQLCLWFLDHNMFYSCCNFLYSVFFSHFLIFIINVFFTSHLFTLVLFLVALSRAFYMHLFSSVLSIWAQTSMFMMIITPSFFFTYNLTISTLRSFLLSQFIDFISPIVQPRNAYIHRIINTAQVFIAFIRFMLFSLSFPFFIFFHLFLIYWIIEYLAVFIILRAVNILIFL